MEYTKEMIERLIHSHENLFRRLNQINNRVPQPPATQRALKEARILNQYFADDATEIFIKNKVNINMPDITKCINEDCPIKETCYRWTSIASAWQSYANFNYENGCDDYLEL